MSGSGRRSNYRKHVTDNVLHALPEPDESIGQRIARVVGTRGGNMFDVVVDSSHHCMEKVDSGSVGEASLSKGESEILESSTKNEDGVDIQQCTNSIREHPTIRAPQLAYLPTKFKKLIWIKRNDFVIVECGDEDSEEKEEKYSSSGGGGFRYAITHVLYKDQVKHIKARGLWPTDPFFADDDHSATSSMGDIPTKSDQQNGNIPSDILPKVGGGGGDDDDDDSVEESNDGGTYEDNGIVFDDTIGDELMSNTNRISTLRVEESSSEDDSD